MVAARKENVTPVELQVCRYAVALYFRFLSQYRVEFVLSTIHYKMIKLMNRKDKINIHSSVNLPCRISSEHNTAIVAKIEEFLQHSY